MLKVAGGGTAGGVVYQGTWNASTNTPTLTSSVGTKGYYYLVSVGGSTNLNGITTWNAGDWAVFDGTVWERGVGGTPSTSFTLGNTVVSLGGTTSAVGNLTLNNPSGNVVPAIPTSSITNTLLQNSAVNFTYSNGVTGTASVSLGGTNALTLTNIPNSAFANSNITLGNTALTLGSTTSAVGNLTINNVTINSGTVNVQTVNHTAATASNATMSTASIPLVPLGYLSFDLNGTVVKIPYYAV